MPEYKQLPIEQLTEPEVTARVGMDETKLEELRLSVSEVGYIHPLAVIPVADNGVAQTGSGTARKTKGRKAVPQRYEIVDGHRRYKVGIMLGLKELPCLVFRDAETARHAVKLHANLCREDMSTAEESAYLAQLVTIYDYTEEQLCAAVHKSPQWVDERLRLFHGNQDIFHALAARNINLGVAKELNKIVDKEHARYLLHLAIEGGATRLTVSKWVAEWRVQKQRGNASEAGAVAVISEATVEQPPLPKCVICDGDENPYHFRSVLIHEYCQTTLERQKQRAAQFAAQNEGG